jgi:catechol 2,3-dioxygenase-like lactoylglutathione lyase family enzyme
MHILETCLYVHELERAETFYRALGFEFVSRVAGRHVFFRAGEGMLLLFDPKASVIAGELPPHGALPGGHVCFAATRAELDAWQTGLQELQIEFTRYTWSRDRGDSLYFRDPDGNLLEIAPPSIWGIAEP